MNIILELSELFTATFDYLTKFKDCSRKMGKHKKELWRLGNTP